MEKPVPKESSKGVDLKVMRTEFELYHIISCGHFKRRLLERCRNANISGYVMYKNNGRIACGVMEGLPEDINQLKLWISTRFIPELFVKRSTFSAYEICFNPDRQEFCERTSVPDKEPLLADMYEKDIVNPEERAKQQAKAEAEESNSFDSHDETVTGSVGGFDSH
nr:uncharacterized protein LOC122321991 [Drosophila bipectinata]